VQSRYTSESRDLEIRSHGDAKESQNQEEATSTPLLITHSQNRGGIASYFKNADDPILLVTDGLIGRPPDSFEHEGGTFVEVAKWKRAFEIAQRSYGRLSPLPMHVTQAAASFGDAPLVDRRTLAEIMNRAITLGGRAPKAFFKTMKDFQEHGGEITHEKPNSRPKEPVAKWALENFNSYREAWQKLAGDPDVPRKVLDQYYDGDAMPDKPPAPWRQ
jgi:hypothetical protein